MGRFTITIVSKQAKITDQTHSKKRFLGWFNKFCNTPSLPHWRPLMATALEGCWKGDCTVPAITVGHHSFWGVRIFQLWYIFKVTSSCLQSWHQTDRSFTESSHFFGVHSTLIDWARQQDKATAGALTVWDTEAQKGFLIEECIFQKKP